MGVIRYQLTLTAPAIFTRGVGDPNTVDSWTHVPGSRILGALAARWLAQHPKADAAADADFQRLFLNGSVCYLHAYPAYDRGTRMLPAPLTLYEPRDTGARGELIDRAIDPQAELDPDLRQAALGYIVWRETRITYYRPALRRHQHHERERVRGRPTDGNIFTYEALPAGSRFSGAILTERDEDEALLASLITRGPLRVGRSLAAEYGGQAEVELIEATRADWQEVTPVFERQTPELLVVTLLSEYLGRNPNGEMTPEAFKADLEDALSTPLIEVHRFVRYHSISGYVAAWSMPRPPHPALAAGSVFLYERPEGMAIPARVLSLGDRRAEGFGRVALDWHGVESDEELKKQEWVSKRPLATISLTPPVGVLQAALWQQWLLERVPLRVGAIHLTHPPPRGRWPSPSSIGTMRGVLARNTGANDAAWQGLVGQQVLDGLQNCKISVPGPRQERFTLHELVLRLLDMPVRAQQQSSTQGTTPDRAIDLAREILVADESVPPFLKEVRLETEAARRVTYALLDAILDHVRRRATEERIDEAEA